MKQNLRAAVVGGGIAAGGIAYALNKRNIETTIFESKSNVAEGASGNPVGLVYPFLTKQKTVESDFSIQAFLYFLEIWQKENFDQKVSNKDGIYFLLHTQSLRDRYQNAILNHNLSNEIAYLKPEPDTNLESIFYPKGKTIQPKVFTKTLLATSDAVIKREEVCIGFYETEQNVRLKTNLSDYEFDYLFLCNSYSSLEFSDLNWIPSKKVRGQILILNQDIVSLPNSILYGDYLSTSIDGEIVLGASYDEFRLEEISRTSDSLSLLEGTKPFSLFPNPVLESLRQNVDSLKTRVSFRHQSEDRRPILGSLCKAKDFIELVKKSGKKQGAPPPITHFDRIGVVLSLGSRGLTHSLLGGELTVSYILGELNHQDSKKQLLESHLMDRFLLRMWKRGDL